MTALATYASNKLLKACTPAEQQTKSSFQISTNKQCMQINVEPQQELSTNKSQRYLEMAQTNL